MPRIGMLSRILVGALGVEGAFYGGVIAAGLWLAGAPLWLMAVLCAVLGLLLRLLLTVNMFRASERYRMKRAPEQQIGKRAALRLFLAEYFYLLRLFAWLHPFEFLLTRRDADPAGAGAVILCVHGYTCNGGYWEGLRPVLARAGFPRTYTINMDPTFGSIEDFAAQVALRVQEIKAQTGVDKVALIGHSMGGLVSRCYVQRHGGAEHVSKIITLGTPHHGTVSAYKGPGEDARQMRPGNAWLTALNAESPVNVPITSIYTFHDNIVFPQDNAVLAHAKTIGLAGIGHLELAFSKPVQELIIEELRSV
jgi:triacylglycerol lipase